MSVRRTHEMRSIAALGLALATLAACTLPTDVTIPADAIRMAPPKPYALWWSIVESCSARRGELSRVQWFVVPDAATITVGGKEYSGYWLERGNRIVLAGKSVLHGGLVRHEMLHALSGGAHSRDYFVTRCGGVVDCVKECEAEAGKPDEPTGAALAIEATSLELSLRMIPSAPSMMADSGWVVLEVTVKNPRSEPVWAHLQSLDNFGAATTFGYTIGRNQQPKFETTYEFIESTRIGFGPKGIRRETFDTRLSSGTYTITGTFNDRPTTSIEVTVP